MQKEQLLQELSRQIKTGEINKAEIAQRIGLSPQEASLQPKVSRFSLTKILYFLGGAIAIVGLSIFIAQVWTDLGSAGRVLVTLGLGVILAMLGSILLKQKPQDKVGIVFHSLGGLLIPGGALVTLSEFNVETVTLWPVALTFGMLFVFYFILNHIHKNEILVFFTMANGTACFYLLVEALVQGRFYEHGVLYAYLTMVVGIVYLLLAYTFREKWHKVFSNFIYLAGLAGLLGGAFSQVTDSIIWQLLFVLLVAGGMILSAKLKNLALLLADMIFILIYVSYLTGEYFADSLGWPISLVILGFVFIALGYFSVSLGKKYLKS